MRDAGRIRCANYCADETFISGATVFINSINSSSSSTEKGMTLLAVSMRSCPGRTRLMAFILSRGYLFLHMLNLISLFSVFTSIFSNMKYSALSSMKSVYGVIIRNAIVR